MDKKKILLIALVLIILFGLGIATKIFFLDAQSRSIAALRVDSFPSATVFLDGKQVGQTPYSNEKLSAGEYRLKLVVSGVNGTFTPYETKVKLTPEGLTYVSRDIGADDQTSGGQILWLEKLPNDQASEVAIISDPENATVKVDAQEKGKASLILNDISAADHEIAVTADGFSDQIVKAKIIGGFRLNIAVKLAKSSAEIVQNSANIATPAAALVKKELVVATASAGLAKPYVTILETGVGFLRVRVEPSTSATESARVKPGDKYPLVSETSGWVKIKLSSSSGWVSDKYVDKVK